MRRPQFTLKTMLWLTAVISLPLVLVAYRVDWGVHLAIGSILGTGLGFASGRPIVGAAFGMVLIWPLMFAVILAVDQLGLVDFD